MTIVEEEEIREGLTGKAAVGRLALHGREYLVAIVPHERAMLIRQILGSFDTDASLDDFTDNYQAALKKMLADKEPEAVAGTEEAGGKPAKVVDLMDALRQSLDRVKTQKKARRVVLSHPTARARRKAS
jgi:DNA end-binding protein Ku